MSFPPVFSDRKSEMRHSLPVPGVGGGKVGEGRCKVRGSEKNVKKIRASRHQSLEGLPTIYPGQKTSQ